MLLHAGLYFPRSRPSLLRRRWVLPGAYGLAGLAVVIMLARPGDPPVLALLAVMVGYLALVRWLGRHDVSPETRRLQRAPTIAGAAGLGLAIALWFVARAVGAPPSDPGFGGLALLAIPLAHLWVIGRHRLLDLDLRLRRHVQYTFPRLRRLLADVEAEYLYPLRSHDELVGALVVGEKLAEDVFRDEDFEFLGALASQVAPAIENAFLYSELAQQERMKHELEIARRIQMESLPQFTPSVDGLDVAGISIPAFEVGGDYFDYLNGGPRQLTVMVGDVSGKGTSAALDMSRLQGIVRSLHAFDLSPHEFFVRTNDLLCQDLERRSFVTALGGFFDAARGQMVLARAGHLPLYHFSLTDGEVRRVLTRGMGFGLSTRIRFEVELEEEVIPYGPGDVFLFITDGITECLGPAGEDFGEDRVQALLARHAGGSALEIRDEVTRGVRAFSATVEQFDDQTVVVVKAI